MKKFFRIGSGRKKSADASSVGKGSTRSLNQGQGDSIGYEVREKDLGKLHKAAWNGDVAKIKQLAKKDANSLDKEKR